MTTSSLLEPATAEAIRSAAAAEYGRRWTSTNFVDLRERASHDAGVFVSREQSIFAKLSSASDASEQFRSELAGLEFLRTVGGARVPLPLGSGILELGHASVLLLEAVDERTVRTLEDWRSIGSSLARLHEQTSDMFGLEAFDGYFGPLRQDNRPVASNSWAEFYGRRRLGPRLVAARASGHLPEELAEEIEGLIECLPSLCGPDPVPALLHGDAQQNNFLSGADGAVLIDACPYYGHPEVDLALLDYFQDVPHAVFDGYAEIRPIDPGFEDRRELWRMPGYLAIIEIDGDSHVGQQILGRLTQAVDSLRRGTA